MTLAQAVKQTKATGAPALAFEGRDMWAAHCEHDPLLGRVYVLSFYVGCSFEPIRTNRVPASQMRRHSIGKRALALQWS